MNSLPINSFKHGALLTKHILLIGFAMNLLKVWNKIRNKPTYKSGKYNEGHTPKKGLLDLLRPLPQSEEMAAFITQTEVGRVN